MDLSLVYFAKGKEIRVKLKVKFDKSFSFSDETQKSLLEKRKRTSKKPNSTPQHYRK